MKEIFERVQTEFMMLSILLDDLDFEKEMKNIAVYDKVNDALCNTYITLNQGFCESEIACKKCSDNRDELEALIRLIDEAERHENLKGGLYLALEDFRLNIPNVLRKMESVYLENLQKVHG